MNLKRTYEVTLEHKKSGEPRVTNVLAPNIREAKRIAALKIGTDYRAVDAKLC